MFQFANSYHSPCNRRGRSKFGGTSRSNRRLLIGFGNHLGVSLLEVMFAIGIVAVGLLGVMILVPLAGARATRGIIADSADRLGRNAVRTFRVQQMQRPDNWAYYDHNSRRFYSPVTFLTPDGTQEFPDNVRDHGSFCIDPQMLAQHQDLGNPLLRWFPPDSPPNPPLMRRITLRTAPNVLGTTPHIVDPDVDTRRRRRTFGLGMEHASQLFMGTDDLVFELPEDPTRPPYQNFSISDSGDVIKRQTRGAFSWMATLTPRTVGSDHYVLSIVVFHRRILELDEERISDVLEFSSQGMRGGEVILTSNNVENVQFEQGQWLMLFGGGYFMWYRIQSSDYDPDEDRAYVTLFGQDWPVWAASADNTRAVWIPGTIAVYERTVRLETSSLWTIR